MGVVRDVWDVFQDFMNTLSKEERLELMERLAEQKNRQALLESTILDGGKKVAILDEENRFVRGVIDTETGQTTLVGPPGSLDNREDS